MPKHQKPSTLDILLKEINSIAGVTGTFICQTDGIVLAKTLSKNLDEAQLELAARIAGQTFQALETNGQRVHEVALSYDKGKLVLKHLPGSILAILCARNVNLSLLNLTVNAAVEKLAAELERASAS